MNGETARSPELFRDLPRGHHANYVGRPPNAYFENPRDILATPSLHFDGRRNAEGKLFLGILDGEILRGPRMKTGRPTWWLSGGTPVGWADDRHAILIAASRTGKGRSVLLPNLFLFPRDTSLLVFDTKGTLARLTATWRRQVLGQRVGVLDPFDCSGPSTRSLRVVLNAVDIVRRADPKRVVPLAKMVADALIVAGDFKDRHWDETAKQIVAALIVHVALHSKYEGMRDLVTLWQLASQLATPDPHDHRRYWLERELLENEAAGGMVANAARNFYNRFQGEFSSVLSNLTKHLDWISVECMQDVLRGDSVDLREMARGSLALYVAAPSTFDSSGWRRLIFQLALAAFEEEGESRDRQAIFMLDEFHSLGRLTVLEKAIAQIAGMGVKLWIVLQDLSQLKENYPNNYETFIANAGLIQAFGLADQTTLSYLSQLLGESLTLTRSTNMPTFEQAAKEAMTGESWSLSNNPLMTPEEIGRYFARDDQALRQLIVRPGYRPMILQRAFYDKHELFQGRAKIEG